MNSRLLLAALAAGLLAGRASAEAPGVGGAQFLTIEQGARALGMGGAFSALADDANALWWNPAGLARTEFSELSLSHTAYLDNVATEYAGFVRPVAPLRGSLGVSVMSLSIPGIEGADALGNSTGKITAGGYVGALSYGTTVTPGLTVGVTGKHISQKLASYSGSGLAADLGAQYWEEKFGVGVSIQNLGPSFKIGSGSNPLPRAIRGGAFYRPKSNIVLSFEEEKPYNDIARAHIGGEWSASQALRLRAGFQQTPNVGGGAGFTVGFGLAGAYGGAQESTSEQSAAGISVYRPFWDRLSSSSGPDAKTSIKRGAWILGVDYAFVSYGDLADAHRITLSARF